MHDKDSKPYLSIVVTSRNDNHGGDLLQRMQTFIDSLAELSDRFSVPLELIIVEWNPPTDRPKLAEVLSWPASKMCDYRIVEVPPEVHNSYRICGPEMPLFQMIAKNVGIRRARADFVLATNLDLIFSEELMEWLATRPLEAGTYYRVDRHDVPIQVMKKSGVDAQLAFSKKNILRINFRFGTFDSGCFHIDKNGNLKSAIIQLSRLGEKLEKLDRRYDMGYRVSEFAFTAGRHWQKSKSHFRDALKKMSLTSLVRGVLYSVKTAVRISRMLVRAVKLLLWYMCYSTLKFTRPQKSPKPSEKLLHTNACGDFTLLAKQDWDWLHAYAEHDIFSWHLDTIMLYVASAAGLKQDILPHPIYHIEHGGGWTPDSEEELFARLDSKGIPYFTNKDLESYFISINASPQPVHLTGELWGMKDKPLPDYIVTSDTNHNARVA